MRARIAENESERPYVALISTPEEPTWSETAVAYATLYHHISLGKSIWDAVQHMKAASGHQTFLVEMAQHSRENFLEYLKTQAEPPIRPMTLGQFITATTPSAAGGSSAAEPTSS
jgi:hypothetical protein